jgi:hypothetical protein
MTDFWFTTGLLLYSYTQGGSIENTSGAQKWIYANHIENTSSSVVVYTARCIETEVIRLLFAYSLSRECVYGAVAQQRVYMLQYINSLEVPVLTGSFFTMIWETPNILRQGPGKILFHMHLQVLVPMQSLIRHFKRTS